MPCCQISISHGRFCGLRIIFAMAAEHLNPADSLREMKCCADGALLPRGPAQLRTQPGADPPLSRPGRAVLPAHPSPPTPAKPVRRGEAGRAGPPRRPLARRGRPASAATRSPAGTQRPPSAYLAPAGPLVTARIAPASQLAFAFKPDGLGL